MVVDNVMVYGLNESMVASSYPMKARVGDNFKELAESVYDNIKNESYTRYDKAAILAKSPIGSGHPQWLAGVIVQFDLTFSQKAWVELQRYHFIDFVSLISGRVLQ